MAWGASLSGTLKHGMSPTTTTLIMSACQFKVHLLFILRDNLRSYQLFFKVEIVASCDHWYKEMRC